MRALMRGPAQLFHTVALLRMELPVRASASVVKARAQPHDRYFVGAFIGFATLWAGWLIIDYMRQELAWSDVWQSVLYTIFTMVRVILLMALATAVWVPVGVWIGLRPAVAEKVQPLAHSWRRFRRMSFSGCRRSYSQVLSEPRHLAKFSDHLRHSVVHSFQRDRWRFGVSERSQGGGVEFSHSRLELVEKRHYSRDLSLLHNRSADCLGRIVERGDRCGICEMGQ